MSVVSMESMEGAIIRGIQQEADRIREEVIAKAVEHFESELRQSVLKSAVKITNHYDMHRRGDSLVLTVRTGATQ
jgi:hypothetical protein